MKNFKTILTILSICSVYSFADAQGNCPGGNVKVYRGASGCQCQCQKECVTPAELPAYLAEGWNTYGCWNCCKAKNYVDAGAPDNFPDKLDSLSIFSGLVSTHDVRFKVMDMTGRYLVTAAIGVVEDEHNEITLEQSGLEPGVYLLHLESTGSSEVKKVMVTD